MTREKKRGGGENLWLSFFSSLDKQKDNDRNGQIEATLAGGERGGGKHSERKLVDWPSIMVHFTSLKSSWLRGRGS